MKAGLLTGLLYKLGELVKTITELDRLLKWSVELVGVPGLRTSLPNKLVKRPSVLIPSFVADSKIRKQIACLRYPAVMRRTYDIPALWQIYESMLEVFGSRPRDSITDIPEWLANRLIIPKRLSNYLFGTNSRECEVQLAYAAYVFALIAIEVNGCKGDVHRSDITAKVSRGAEIGIKDGMILSRFYKNLEVKTDQAYLSLFDEHPRIIRITSPVIINAYHRATMAGEEVVEYFLDCAVWLSQHRGEILHKRLFPYVKALMDEFGENVVDITVFHESKNPQYRLPLSSQVLEQCRYVIDNSHMPRKALYGVLVPTVMSTDDFKSYFGNPYNPLKVTPEARAKLSSILENLRKRRVGK